MLPLLPFAAGILAGAAAVRLLRDQRTRLDLDKLRNSLGKAQETLREAAVSGLAGIEHSSARAKERLSAPPAAAPAAAKPVRRKAADKVAGKVASKSAGKAADKPAGKAAAPRQRKPKATTP